VNPRNQFKGDSFRIASSRRRCSRSSILIRTAGGDNGVRHRSGGVSGTGSRHEYVEITKCEGGV
jgi:hypothetical protein